MNASLKRRTGFTLVEVTLACTLTAFLAVLLSTTWALLMRPTADLIVWGQLFQEMDIAVASLARDLGGGQLDYDDGGYLGEKRQGQLLECRTNVAGDRLFLCFDGGLSPNSTADWGGDDTVIEYYVDGNSKTLFRRNSTHPADPPFTVAKNVDSMTVTSVGSDLQIVLEFKCQIKVSHRTASRKCTLITKKNP